MKRLLGILLSLLLLISILTGCSLTDADNAANTSGDTAQITYEQITADEAKSIMDSEDSYIILDVRTQEEYDAGHIEGAILIPDYEIATEAESVLTDKDELILVYCRSGRRSVDAANELAALGYTNVKEFGGIKKWPYGTVNE